MGCTHIHALRVRHSIWGYTQTHKLWATSTASWGALTSMHCEQQAQLGGCTQIYALRARYSRGVQSQQRTEGKAQQVGVHSDPCTVSKAQLLGVRSHLCTMEQDTASGGTHIHALWATSTVPAGAVRMTLPGKLPSSSSSRPAGLSLCELGMNMVPPLSSRKSSRHIITCTQRKKTEKKK